MSNNVGQIIKIKTCVWFQTFVYQYFKFFNETLQIVCKYYLTGS